MKSNRAHGLNLHDLADPHGWLADPESLLDFADSWQQSLQPELDRRWLYFTDEPIFSHRLSVRGGENGRPMVTGQEIGLPFRISGLPALGPWWTVHPQIDQGGRLDLERKEVVTENEIGWRVRTFVDWCVGDAVMRGGPYLRSNAADTTVRDEIESLLAAVFDGQQRSAWLRAWCTQSAVYGFADVHVRLADDALLRLDPNENRILEVRDARGEQIEPGDFNAFATILQWKVIDPREIVPLRNPRNADRLWGWIRRYFAHAEPTRAIASRRSKLISRRESAAFAATEQTEAEWIELHTPERVRIYARPATDNPASAAWVQTWDAPTRTRGLPIIHKGHEASRARYDGCGIVEPLIPLQNELNTRLSDRAHKITMQSFRMYLGKGLESFEDRVIGPGRMWHTDNPEASIEEFGGATSDPGENLHIQEVRDAMDRVSAIPALAAGDLKQRIGNLTSATALQTVLRGLLSKVHAQREIDGRALAQIAERTLDLADALGVLPTSPQDRSIRVEWPAIEFVDSHT